MNSLTQLIVAVVVIALGYWLGRKLSERRSGSRGAVKELHTKKQKNLEKLRGYIQAKNDITNNDVEDLLGVSDATASRYLSELEADGEIEERGDGRSTYYVKR